MVLSERLPFWTPETLIEKYPELYHVTCPRNVSLITKHGLRCAAQSLRNVKASEPHEAAKPYSVRLTMVSIGAGEDEVWLNDQIPMSRGVLNRCELPKGQQAEQWVNYLDRHVFFWATKERLGRFLYVRGQRCYQSYVFRIKTKALIETLGKDVWLSQQNSGGPFPQKPTRRHSFVNFGSDELDQWYCKNNELKDIVEVVVRDEAVPPRLLEAMPSEEWQPLLEHEAKNQKERKARRNT